MNGVATGHCQRVARDGRGARAGAGGSGRSGGAGSNSLIYCRGGAPPGVSLIWQPRRLPYNSEVKVPSRLRLTFYFLALAGAALFTLLLIREGAPQVGQAVAAAGWAILAVIAYHFLVPVVLDALAWWILFPQVERPQLRRVYWMRWIGESVSTLVPSAAVGGDLVRARLAAISGSSVATAAGTVLVDLTLGVFTQAAFTLLGVVLLVGVTGQKNFVRPTLMARLSVSSALRVSTLCNGWECSAFSPSSSRAWRTRQSGNRSSTEARLSIRRSAHFMPAERLSSRAARGRFFR